MEHWGTGRRKTAIAKVKLVKGQGQMTINGTLVVPNKEIIAPAVLVGQADKIDIQIKVKGGGSHSQVEAMRHGLAKALLANDATLRSTLRKAGWLTRDDRRKERKKYGLKKARRAPQWSKR